MLGDGMRENRAQASYPFVDVLKGDEKLAGLVRIKAAGVDDGRHSESDDGDAERFSCQSRAAVMDAGAGDDPTVRKLYGREKALGVASDEGVYDDNEGRAEALHEKACALCGFDPRVGENTGYIAKK